MATPLTAGAAALVRQYYMDVQHVTPSAALIKATLISGAYNMAPGQYGTGQYREIQNPPDNSQGWGRVNVANSINPAAPGKVSFVDYTEGVTTGQPLSYGYEVIDSSVPVKVVLVWSDYPTTLPAAKDLVNDLDLTVTRPDGKIYYGNKFDATGFSTPFSVPDPTQYDRTNNVEVVNIKPSATGLLEIAVNGSAVPDGPQPFALVINGGVISQDAAVNFSMSMTQEGGAVTLSAQFSLGDTPMVKKLVTFYDQTGAGTPVKKGTVKTNTLGIATLKFTAASGSHTAYATTPAIPSIGITQAPSTPPVLYTIGKVPQTSPGAVVNALPVTLSWDTSLYPGATYEVQVNPSPTFPAALMNYATTASSSVSYTDPMLPGTAKYWRVRAVLPTGHSLYSATSKFTYKPVPVLELSPPVQTILNKVALTATVKDGSGTVIGGRKVLIGLGLQPGREHPCEALSEPFRPGPFCPALFRYLDGVLQVFIEHRLHLVGEIGAQYHGVYLVVSVKAPEVHVRGADGGPDPVHHRRLGMQHPALPLEYPDAGLEQVLVMGPSGVERQVLVAG